MRPCNGANMCKSENWENMPEMAYSENHSKTCVMELLEYDEWKLKENPSNLVT